MTARGTRQVAKALRAVDEADGDLAALAAMRALSERVAVLERRVIADARSRGVTWREIGSAYGMSKQAAQQRFRSAVAGDDAQH